MKFNFELQNKNEESGVDRIKKGVKRAALGAMLVTGLSAGSGEAFAQNQVAKKDKIENAEGIKDFNSYINEIEIDPELFFIRIKNDESFAKEVKQSFLSNQSANFERIGDYRIKYFADQGKATMTSADERAPELNGGVVLKSFEDVQKYQDKYPGVSKPIGYNPETDLDFTVKNLVKYIQYKL